MTPFRHSILGKEYLWLFNIIIIGLLIRLAAVIAFNHAPESDELAYKSMASNLVAGNGIVDNMGNHAMYNVGYPLFVLAPVFYFFGEDIFVVRVFHVLLGGVAIACCYAVVREAGAGRIGRLLAPAIWALYLPASVYTVYLYKENLMVPLMLGVIWCALHLANQSSTKTALGCGALFGLLALTGNAALSLAGPVILALILAPASLKKRLALFLCILLVATVVSTPWAIRNLYIIGAPVLNTNGGFNLYLGNNPAATGWFVSISDTPRGPSWKALRKTGEVQASETLKADAVTWIQAHTTDFLALAFKKAMYFWMPPFHQGKGKMSIAETVVRMMWAFQFVILTAIAIGSLFHKELRNRRLIILWSGIACYTAVHMAFYVIFRYREPIMPLLGVIASLAFEAYYLRMRRVSLPNSVEKEAWVMPPGK